MADITRARARNAPYIIRAGGDEDGLWLTANAGADLKPLSDMEFRLNFRLRLGQTVMPAGLCQHRRRPTATCREGKRCLLACDPYGRHALDCMIGGGRNALHDAGCSLCFDAAKTVGMAAQREVITPALAKPKLLGPGSTPKHGDTLRAPTFSWTSQ